MTTEETIGVRQFSPSWLDRLHAGIEGLPVPPWASYLLALLLITLFFHIPFWLDGSVAPGSIEFGEFVAAFFIIYFAALIYYLNTAARGALARYRPLLDLDAHDYAILEYTLTRTPRRTGLLATLLGIILGAASYFPAPGSWGVGPDSSVLAQTAGLLEAMGIQVGVTYWLVHVIRQARTVDRIHGMTTRINIFRLDPVYAFSTLTLRSSLGLLFAAYLYPILAFYFGLPPLSTVDLAMIAVAIVVSLVIFILPLSRMHQRLVNEKGHLIADADERYSSLLGKFNRQLDKGEFADLDVTGRAVETLAKHRDSLAKISTWPWKPETFRSLLSTIALPIILYLASRLIGRLLGV